MRKTRKMRRSGNLVQSQDQFDDAIEITHLLNRKPIVTDQANIAAYLNGATVLVTGAGGSIGSEICCQVAIFGPKEIILLGHGDNSIHKIGSKLQLSFPNLTTHRVIADIKNQKWIDRIIDKYRPTIIIHAAAHKHVPLLETNIEEGIINNIQGTLNVLQAAEKYGVSRFVFISTDKAVNPIKGVV